jgi:hypothetical protein
MNFPPSPSAPFRFATLTSTARWERGEGNKNNNQQSFQSTKFISGLDQPPKALSKPDAPVLIGACPGSGQALVTFLRSAFSLLPFRRNSSRFTPRRAMLLFLGNIHLRDDETIL